MPWRFVICCLLGLICPLFVLADTLVVAGHTQQLSSPLIVEGSETLAPVVPALRLLGMTSSVRGRTVTITAPDGRIVKFTANSTTALADDREISLQSAPREIDGDLYLPIMALAPLVDAVARFDPATKTVTLDPRMNVSCETTSAGVTINVRCEAPLQFASGELSDPPRLFIDVKNVALGLAAQQIPVGAGMVDHIRVAQFSTNPDAVRMVVDLNKAASLESSVSDQGRLVTFTVVDKQMEQPVIQPVTPPVVRGPVKLLDAVINPKSVQQTELTITTDGLANVVDAYDETTHQLSLTFPDGLNVIPADHLAISPDKIVKKLQALGDSNDAGARVLVTMKPDAGYLIQRDANAIHVLMGVFNIADMTIVLDAGHGGHDTGALGQNGTEEKNVTLDVVLRAAKLLQNAGANVLLTRNNDTFIPVHERPLLGNNNNASLFISIHCNSTAVPNSCCGTQTYYNTGQSAELAAAMHTEVVKKLELKNGGVRTANYWVIRYSQMPSVLIELAFINNTREEALLASPDFRQEAAEAIVNGVRRYAACKSWRVHLSSNAVVPVATTTDQQSSAIAQ